MAWNPYCHSKYKSNLINLILWGSVFWENGHGYPKIHGPNTDNPKKP